MNNRQNIESIAPFLKILPLTVAGILIARSVIVRPWVLVVATAICIVCSAVWHKRGIGSLYTAAAIVLFAMLSTWLHKVDTLLPYGKTVELTATVTDNPVTSGRWQRCGATVKADNIKAKIILNIDTVLTVRVGERAEITAQLNPMPDNGYGRLMLRRGYAAACYVSDTTDYRVQQGRSGGVRIAACSLQNALTERFDRLGLSGDNAAVSKAMAFGWRGEMTPALRKEYSRSGCAHLLAVSGLHVGIVAMLINALLCLLPLVGRHGHILRNIAAIAAIWIYAFLTGLSPSVVRAALMFSGLQAGLAAGGSRSAVNILAGTAAIMLLYNPNYLYDISFQLSTVAVAGIAVGYRPLMELLGCRSKMVGMLAGLTVVGICASAATAPIVACTFGSLPVAGIFLNPIVILTANIIVLFSLGWALVPIGFMSAPVATIVNAAAELQNRTVEWIASRSWSALDMDMPAGAVLAIYGVVIAVLIVGTSIKERRKQWRLKR